VAAGAAAHSGGSAADGGADVGLPLERVCDRDATSPAEAARATHAPAACAAVQLPINLVAVRSALRQRHSRRAPWPAAFASLAAAHPDWWLAAEVAEQLVRLAAVAPGCCRLAPGGGRRGAGGGKGRGDGVIHALALTRSCSYADARRLVRKAAAEAAKGAGLPAGM